MDSRSAETEQKRYIDTGFDLVAAIFGEMSPMSRIVYVLVGISAIMVLATSFRLIGDRDQPTLRQMPR